jgi:hypothetical protein
MTEHPILFAGEMVRAILDGHKTQTRRVIKPQPILHKPDEWKWREYRWHIDKHNPIDVYTMGSLQPCPYGKPGDVLWVREAWWDWAENKKGPRQIAYDADHKVFIGRYTGCDPALINGARKRPSIHMPRWACRLFLTVRNVRVERVQDISLEDVKAEGVTVPCTKDGVLLRVTGKYPPHDYWPEGTIIDGHIAKPGAVLKAHFCSLWDSINAKRGYGWDKNPWVWMVEFERRE